MPKIRSKSRQKKIEHNMENRPDFSDYLIHFTKGIKPCVDKGNPATTFAKGKSAQERLFSILKQRTIKASVLPWVKKEAVCFTECVWGSLLSHAQKYSPYGIGFTKKYIFNNGGNPIFYVRPHLYESQQWDDNVHIFTSPFLPDYSDEKMRSTPHAKRVDYTHEREWRLSHELHFNYCDIAFIILKSHKDLEKLPQTLIKKIGEGKFIFMDNYKKVEEIWPLHKIETSN